MKILFLTNNEVSAPVIEWLAKRPECDELVVRGEKLSLADMLAICPDSVISYGYRHIIAAEVLAARADRFINMHIAYLPFNRGADPNAWSFLDNTPKGVSIHLIDSGVDTGRILAQKEVEFDEKVETLAHTYSVLHSEIQALFYENWDAIRTGALKGVPQTGEGTFHFASAFAAIKEALLGAEGWGVSIAVFKDRYKDLCARNAVLEPPRG